MTRSLYLFIISLRPKQWLKNTIIFLPLVFASKLFDFSAIIDTSIIFILFSLFVGTTYILNDLKDIQKDALHPIKSRRPLASGALNHRFAGWGAIILGSICILSIYILFGPILAYIVVGYLVLTTIYTFWLKNIVILDVFTIGILFVIRGMIGSQVVGVDLSQWLIIMLFFGALFLGFFKRYQEVSMGGEHTRKVIKEYNKEFLQQIVSIITAVLIVSYALYTFQSSQPSAMIVTLPFVIFVIVRYYYNILVQQKYKESIEDIIMQDKQILLAGILYIVLTIIILLYTRV